MHISGDWQAVRLTSPLDPYLVRKAETMYDSQTVVSLVPESDAPRIQDPDEPIPYVLSLQGWVALHPEYERVFAKMTPTPALPWWER